MWRASKLENFERETKVALLQYILLCCRRVDTFGCNDGFGYALCEVIAPHGEASHGSAVLFDGQGVKSSVSSTWRFELLHVELVHAILPDVLHKVPE